MKVEIKIESNGACEYFKINGRKFGKGITGYQIFHEAGEKPLIIIKARVEEFILDSEDNALYLDNLNGKSLFQKIKEKIKK
jgi:hypothetical protein